MLGKRYNWVPLPWTRDVRMDSNPGTREYGCKAAPNNVPNGPTMGKVGTTN